MKRVLVTGGAGFLGQGVIRAAPGGVKVHATWHNHPVAGCTGHRVDLADAAAVRRVWDEVRPELVVHTAYRQDAGERDIWTATRNVVDACAATGAKLLHLSTDLVFDGESGPYAEEALPSPVHDYGRWKARAEEYVRQRLPEAAVVRNSLITSFAPPDPRTSWVADGLRGSESLTLFTDELRAPIALPDLVAQLWEIAALEPAAAAGVWHLAGPEVMSRFALGLLIAGTLDLPTHRLRAARSADLAVRRPRDLRLLTARADRQLATHARPVSEWAAESRVAAGG